MPKLPSGRSVVVDFAPMCKLIKQAEREGDAGLLLFVEDSHVFCGLIDLHEAEFRPDIPREELDVVETSRGVRHAIVHETGLTLDDVLEGRSSWSSEDRDALDRFMMTKRVWKEATDLRERLLDLRSELTERAIHEPHVEMVLPRGRVAEAEEDSR
jgi:hypothetical protein